MRKNPKSVKLGDMLDKMPDHLLAQAPPTKDERKRFDFFWQHLRRNEGYRKHYAIHCEAERMGQELSAAMGLARHPDFAPEVDLDPSRNVGGLGVPIDPNITDTGNALKVLLAKRPDYFQSPLWPQAWLKTSGAVAWWNQFGAWGCAWSGGTTAIRDFHGSVALFSRLKRAFDHAETNKSKGERFRNKHLKARFLMRKFLESHPHMDFVIDTTLPPSTIRNHFERQLAEIKQLRQRVGLRRDDQPPRLRDWSKHLELYDAYLPCWESNKRKFEALQRIWRDHLGFLKAFELLGVDLSDSERQLANTLDRQGLRPKGFYKFAGKVMSELTPIAGYSVLGQTDLPAHKQDGRYQESPHAFVEGSEDEDGGSEPMQAVGFDYGEVEALIDGAEAEVLDEEPCESQEHKAALLLWRPYFSIPPVHLPAPFDSVDHDKRHNWFRSAQRRIRAAWPYSV